MHDRTSEDHWQDIVEEHYAIADTIREYVSTLDAAQQTLRSQLEKSERTAALLAHYLKMRELGHKADVNIAKLGERLTLTMHEAKR
ncbi:MAG TPA: hypothetical protein VMI09_17185 [Candidatus Binataceae bacterium]|nr:hypothetical protein [Candidatus Binataceae bacterium]